MASIGHKTPFNHIFSIWWSFVYCCVVRRYCLGRCRWYFVFISQLPRPKSVLMQFRRGNKHVLSHGANGNARRSAIGEITRALLVANAAWTMRSFSRWDFLHLHAAEPKGTILNALRAFNPVFARNGSEAVERSLHNIANDLTFLFHLNMPLALALAQKKNSCMDIAKTWMRLVPLAHAVNEFCCCRCHSMTTKRQKKKLLAATFS